MRSSGSTRPRALAASRRLLWGRRRIKGLRFFVLFVVPEYRMKGVTGGIFLRTFEAAVRRGMPNGETGPTGFTASHSARPEALRDKGADGVDAGQDHRRSGRGGQ
ncbi:MAG: hypothetical protein ACYC9Q_08790 [Bacillota bacterium]